MNYCSLNDAFPSMTGGAPSPGCTAGDDAAKAARREERRKARRCRGPPATFLNIGTNGSVTDDKDPDRQHLNRPPIIPAMNPATGLREHVPVTAPDGELEPFQDAGAGPGIEADVASQRMSELLPRTDGDPIGDAQRSTLPVDVIGSRNNCKTKKNFFGADPCDEPFADYTPDAKSYLMQPNFADAFKQSAYGRVGANLPHDPERLPVPSVRDFWKPITPSGVSTSFFESLPAPGGTYPKYPSATEQPQQMTTSLEKKLDKIFARLDEIQGSATSPENSQTEIMLFVSSGIIVLFLMDLLVKKVGR
jgi:hypothetical protein